MSSTNDLLNVLNNLNKNKTGAYDTKATVVRVEGDTAWVHIAGGVDETPIQRTINCKAGDSVQVRVSGGRGWITGNTSAPPTDDTVANEAKDIANNADGKATNAQKTAEKADAIATAVGQHFWYDDSGAHISTENGNPDGEQNSIWNTLGMIFRKGLNRVLAIMTGNITGIAIYDGQGNSDDNIVASFTNSGVQLGKSNENIITMLPEDSLEMKDALGETLFKVENKTSSDGSTFRDYLLPITGPYAPTAYESGTYTATLSADYDTISNYVFTGVGSNGMQYGERPITFFGTVTLNSYSGNEVTFTFTKNSQTGWNLYGLIITYNAPLSKSRLITGAYADTDNDALFVVGNGSGDDSRHNALQLEKDGTLGLEGNLECNQVYSNNLTGSQSADLTCFGKFGNLTIITGTKVCKHSATVGQETFSVDFGTTFKYLPNVQLTSRNARGNYIGDLTVAGLSTTGFNISIYSRESAAHTYNIGWFAIGERA